VGVTGAAVAAAGEGVPREDGGRQEPDHEAEGHARASHAPHLIPGIPGAGARGVDAQRRSPVAQRAGAGVPFAAPVTTPAAHAAADPFESSRQARNAAGVTVGAALIAIVVPAFWALDFYVIPAWVRLTFFVRLGVAAYALGVLLWVRTRPAAAATHADALALSLSLLVCWMLSLLCWLGQGYESPYCAGLNLVFVTAAFLFAWPPQRVLLFYALVYGVYMTPLALGLLGVHDRTLVFSNQFFILSTIVVTFVSHRHRYLLEQSEQESQRKTERLLDEVRSLAVTDTLTALVNRRQLFTVGEAEMARARRHGHPLSVLMIDIDGFKRINDGNGHAAGDAVLQEVAARVIAGRRQEDTAARYGGDEIVMLLPETDAGAALLVAERVRLSVGAEPIRGAGGALRVTLSIGVATASADVSDLAALLCRADEALYAAKRAGRDQSAVWAPPTAARA
jgi:diguanylate cyclase (GGDEF)-like protein